MSPGKTRAVRRRPSPVSEPGNHATVVPYPIPPLIIGLGPPPACHVRICFLALVTSLKKELVFLKRFIYPDEAMIIYMVNSSCPWFCSFHNLGVAFVISLQRLKHGLSVAGWITDGPSQPVVRTSSCFLLDIYIIPGIKLI